MGHMLSNRSLSTVLSMLITAALVVPAAQAQDSVPAVRHQPRWTLSALFEVLHAGADAWGFGPTLAIRRDFGAPWGVELRAALPAFNESGGAAIDLAATYTSSTETR